MQTRQNQTFAYQNGFMKNLNQYEDREDDDQVTIQRTYLFLGTRTFGKSPSNEIQHQNVKKISHQVLTKAPMLQKNNYILQTLFQTCQKKPQLVFGKQRTSFPFYSIGYLTMFFPKLQIWKNNLGQKNESSKVTLEQFQAFGTATLIYRDILLTAAHNLYDSNRKQKASIVSFVGGLDGSCYKQVINAKYKKNKNGALQPEIYIPTQYMDQRLNQDEKRRWDFGIVVLNRTDINFQLDQQFGYLGVNSQVDLQGEDLLIAGYPKISEIYTSILHQTLNKAQPKISSKTNSQENINKYLFKAQGKTHNLSQDHISYLIPTEKGQSGSPILRKIPNKEYYQIVAIHTHGNKIQQCNVGLRITERVINQINQWISIDKIKLQKSWCSLKILNLDSFVPKSFNQKEFLSNIVTLCLAHNQLEDQAMIQLAQHSNQLTRLQDLDLYGNLITNQGMKKFLKKKFSFLHRFDTSLNLYDQSIAQFFLQNQKNFPTLQSLLLHKGNNEKIQKLKENIKFVRVYVDEETN